MSDPSGALQSAFRTAYAMGLALCVGTPLVVSILILAAVVPPGQQAPEGILRDLGYLFSGIVFLGGAWVLWRSGRELRRFGSLPAERRPFVCFRECVVYAAVFEVSCILGLIYWILVGSHATRHVWGFILLTPILFFALVPRLDRWVNAN